MNLTLPPVAKSFHTQCKKCGADRYHTVLAHTSSTSAKLQCEICGSKKTYNLKEPKSTSSGILRSKASNIGGSAGMKVSKSKLNHTEFYEDLKTKMSATQNYNMKLSFKLNEGIQHPKFGLGVVTQVYSEKVDVCFADEVKSLVHGRS